MAETRILSTKKLQINQKQFLLNAGFSVIEADFIQIMHQPFELKNTNETLIFTSQNAVYAILENKEVEKLKNKSVFCVGLKTKALLEEKGFKVEAYTGYAADLAEIISLVYADTTYTFFSGNLRRDTLPELLTENGITFNEIEVYQTLLTPQKINSKSDALLFFSPSGVESYTKDNKITTEVCFCIGDTTAEAVEKYSQNIVIANQPSVENVIIQCINYYKADC
ncbi:uroporphyrinogen-III synthase [Flavobacterium amnicola]|uniref:Uroporphyrinogen-III synthase n=1 Tax=Flavobacterium amnicola TaxID=2506422 RepID=A0A4Q1K8X9_9FLAO|nr:uroporphyrinogen-III synthase [Flavobacterium amnicola]RXR21049.1 uroporphyrinogen-III synthase [Flavobacterium amnicola]